MRAPDPQPELENLRERWLAQWQAGAAPDLTAFLSSVGSVSPAELAELIQIEMQQRRQRGEAVAAEDYLARHAVLAQDRAATLDVIYAEYLLRERDAETLVLAEFLQRFPEYAATLQQQIELHRACLSTGAQDTSSRGELTDMDADARPGRSVAGRFRLLRRLGRGGMGEVWEAQELAAGRRVALKLLRTRVAGPEEARRCLQEGRLAAAVAHPRCVFVFEAGLDQGQPYFVQELMPGATLAAFDQQRPLPAAVAVDYALDVLDGLAALHQAGVLHRDLKPANCFLDSSGRPAVGDFGLALSLTEVRDRASEFAGTPGFAAPEQVRGEPLDERADQYSLGATLFALLAGRAPFVGPWPQTLAQTVHQPPPPCSAFRPDLPRELDAILARMLAKHPRDRFASLGRVRQAWLPFSAQATALATIGRRLAAYAVDELLLTCCALLLAVCACALKWLASDLWSDAVVDGFRLVRFGNLTAAFAMLALEATYYPYVEGIWGAGAGKRLFGLRVIGPDGGAPGVRRCALRTWFIPLGCGFALLGPLAVQRQMPLTPAGLDPLTQILLPLATTLLASLPAILCLSAMRTANGLRGWHELLSGTRVVQLPDRPVEPGMRAAAPQQRATSPARQWGPFAAVRRLYAAGTAVVWEAHDDVLRRPVWIMERPSGESPVSAARIALARTTRLRWLQQGQSEHGAWDAFEAPCGQLLSPARARALFSDWDAARRPLLHLTEELAAGLRDGTLPAPLGWQNLCVSAHGRLQLLDVPPEADPASGRTAAWGAAALVRAFAAAALAGRVQPRPAQRFLDRAADAPAEGAEEIAHLAALAELLRAESAQPTSLRWDDRLGLLGLAAFTSGWPLAFAALASGVAWVGQTMAGRPGGFAAHLLGCLALPALPALIWGKNLRCKLLGVEVLRRDGSPAGRFRNALRDVCAWLPWMLAWALCGWCVGAASHVGWQNAPAGTLHRAFVAGCLCGGPLPLAVFVASGWYALRHPGRALHDRLAGTHLFLG